MNIIYLSHQNFEDLPPTLQKSIYFSFYNLVFQDINYLLGGDRFLTEDIIQESFLKIISNIRKHKVKNLKAWLRKVTRNTTLDYLKINHQATEAIVNVSRHNTLLAVEQHSVVLQVEKRIRDELLHNTIGELNQEYQKVITLFYIKGMSYREIASLLCLSEQAVSQKLARARRKLFLQFQKKWANI